ncbi:MAG: DUF3892 domain-containing protein [Aridibacter sp.]
MTKSTKPKRKITDAVADDKGNITKVKIQGNKTFTPVKTAIQMTKRGEIDAVAVKKTAKTKEHLRTRPNSKTSDNLDDLAGDK